MPTSPEGPSPEYRHAVALRGVSVGYGPDLALEAVDANVGLGVAVALVGPNGAGKSSLLKAILGLLPLRAGSISVLGRSPAEARPDVGYVPQAATLDGDFPVSVRQVVMMGRYRRVGWLRRPGRADRLIVDDALERAGLGEQARLPFGSLSGGQRQRALVARAIAQEPRLLLLDEPFNGVDAVSQRLLLDTLSGLRAGGASVIMATHDLVAVRSASCECCLLNRRLHAFGTAEEVLTAGPLKEAYGDQALVLEGQGVVVGAG